MVVMCFLYMCGATNSISSASFHSSTMCTSWSYTAQRYAHMMPTVTMFLCSLKSITPVRKTDLLVTVGDATSSLQKSLCCLWLSAHTLPFILQFLFCSINVTVDSTLQFCLSERLDSGICTNTSILLSWASSLFSEFSPSVLNFSSPAFKE